MHTFLPGVAGHPTDQPADDSRPSRTRETHTHRLLNGDLILEITDGPLKGERRKVQRKGATIGRSPDNTLSVSDPELSRRHSSIEFDEGDGKVRWGLA